MSWWWGGAWPGAAQLVWGAAPEVCALAVGLAVASTGIMVARARGLRGKVVDGVVFGTAAAALALALCDPRLVAEAGREERGRVVVLVDGSASMAVEEGGIPRSAAVQAQIDALQADGPVEVYTFGAELTPGVPVKYDGHHSDLGVALAAVADRHLGEQLRGIVVLTDGIDRGPLRRAVREAAGEGRLRADLVPALPGPLTVVPIGSGAALTDLAIEEVVSGGFAFLRTPFDLRAQLRGAPGQTIPVSLSTGGQVVEQQQVSLDAEGRAEARFTITPREVGRFAWELSVPVLAGDAVPGNNTFPVVVRVVRDRTRVLQVSGSPSYDQKFLRLLLKEDQAVDLVSFFILRSTTDVLAGWSPSELSLIEFPYERLFSEDLSTFDLIILQNFNYGPYFDAYAAPDLLQNIANYVTRGGALMMVGGALSFDLGGYAGTPVAGVLPVRLGLDGMKAAEERFTPVLTPAGRAHPLTRLAGDPEETAAAWAALPPMDGLNLSLGPAEGAAVLLEHPTMKVGGQPLPVLTVGEVGEGRSAALMVDASWRWSFSEVAQGKGNQAYLRFWKNALRWLVADPEDRRVVVSPSRENALVGEELRVTIKVRDAAYGPKPDAQVDGLVRAPDGTSSPLSVRTNAAGEVTLTLKPTQQGAHRVEVRSGPLAAERAETVFAVSARDPELNEIAPDIGFLKALVALYGDKATLAEGDLPGAGLWDDEARRRLPSRAELRLGRAPALGLLFGLLFGLGLVVRRRLGAP